MAGGRGQSKRARGHGRRKGVGQEALVGGLGAAEGCFSSRSLHYEPQNMKRR
jgi:hypothetical protein